MGLLVGQTGEAPLLADLLVPQTPPSAEAIAAARKTLQDIHGAKLDTKVKGEAAALARELIDSGQAVADDQASQWVCWDEARRLALAADNKPLSLEAVRLLAETFRYPEPAEPAECIRRAREAWKESEAKKGDAAWPWRLAAWAWYSQAGSDGELKGLNKVEADRRTAEVDAEAAEAGREKSPASAGTTDRPWVNLLNLPKSQYLIIDGTWNQDSQGLSMARRRGKSRLVVSGRATGSYTAELTFRRTAGDDMIQFIFPVGRAHSSLVIYDQSKKHYAQSGITLIDGKGAPDNGTQFVADIQNNQDCTIQVAVRRVPDGYAMVVHYNDRQVVDWKGQEPQLGVDKVWEVPGLGTFGLAGWDVAVTFTGLRLQRN